MAVNVTGTIYVDVEDYQDEIEIHADVEDIYELMMDNGITSADMIEYLKNGESSASEDDVMKYIEEDANHDELFAIQAHAIYTFRRGLWASLSTAYGWGWDPTINGEEVNNPKRNWLTALSFGFPLSRTQGIKLSWLQARTQEKTGADLD